MDIYNYKGFEYTEKDLINLNHLKTDQPLKANKLLLRLIESFEWIAEINAVGKIKIHKNNFDQLTTELVLNSGRCKYPKQEPEVKKAEIEIVKKKVGERGKGKKPASELVAVRIPPDKLKKLDSISSSQGKTRTNLIIESIDQFLLTLETNEII